MQTREPRPAPDPSGQPGQPGQTAPSAEDAIDQEGVDVRGDILDGLENDVPPPPNRAALDALSARIAAAKQNQGQSARRRLIPGVNKFTGASLAWRMVTELVTGVALGFGLGYGLDMLFGTSPILMIIVGLLGVAAGMKVMIETAVRFNQRMERARDTEGGS